ncbi:MAG: amidase, partial [Alphaproteobacteria bacterium]
MAGLTGLSLKAALDGLASKTFSSEEITRDHIAAVEASSALNAFVVETPDKALDMARASDARRASGDAGPLDGAPLGIKDLFCTDGVESTAGSMILRGFRPTYESTVTSNLWRDGAVMLGKLNMDEFAMGSSNETSFFGPVRNPWNPEMVPGGSSGGSAAAVAARIAMGATATDTGGSIRQPAALCGITGIKPTYGRVSRYGMIAFASSLDQAGLITVSAEDAALLLGPMSGFDPRDSTSVESAVPDYTATLGDRLDGLTIGLVREFFDKGLDGDCGQRVREAIAAYEKL